MSADYAADVAAALDKLGATSAEIAQSLADKGITATCASPSSCALAVFIHEQFPELSDVTFGSGYFGGPGWLGALTREQRQFVEAFDRGRFPDLIAP